MALPFVAWPDIEELSRLVEAAQHGEARAVDTLLGTLRPPLLTFFARRLPLDTAEDLVQLALVRITGALPRILPERADRYVMTVARNLIRTEYRRRAREAYRLVALDVANIIASPDSVDTQYHYRELALAVHRASVEVLPPPLRAVVLGLLAGQTPAEIAASLHLSPITVRTRLLRARTILRHELRSLLNIPADGYRRLVDHSATDSAVGLAQSAVDLRVARPPMPTAHLPFGPGDARSPVRRILPPPRGKDEAERQRSVSRDMESGSALRRDTSP